MTSTDAPFENEMSEKKSKLWYGLAGLEDQLSKWKSLGHLLLSKLDVEFRDATIVADFASGRTWTGGQLRTKILNVACALVDKYQFEPGTAVCMLCDNSDYLFILACGVICAGGIVATSYSKDPYVELLDLARKVEPAFLFCHQKNIAWARKLQDDLGLPVRAIIMDKQLDESSEDDYFESLFWYDHTKSRSRDLLPVACKDAKKEVALITMSSGTSGKPKAVAQTHWNALAELFADPLRVEPGSNFACCASLDYVSGRIMMFGAINKGYQVIIINGFEPRLFLQACERYKVNFILTGAFNFYKLITYPQLNKYDLTSVRTVLPAAAKIIYLDEFGQFLRRHPHIVEVRQAYGASEMSIVTRRSATPEEYLLDCANTGKLVVEMQAKIVEPNAGHLLGPNEQGILHVRGPTVFPGYYDRGEMRRRREKRQNQSRDKNAEEHAELVDNIQEDSPFIRHAGIFDEQGYYISGDCAYFNDKEEFYCEGRLNEIIYCRDLKRVLPQELESIIHQHCAVDKVCVLGIANKRELTLQCPRAFVVPKANYYSDERPQLSSRLATLNERLDEEVKGEQLSYSGNAAHPLNKMTAERRHLIVEDLMQFFNERVVWGRQLTGGIVLLDDIPISRAIGKYDKNYLRSLSPDQVEIYGDRSN